MVFIKSLDKHGVLVYFILFKVVLYILVCRSNYLNCIFVAEILQEAKANVVDGKRMFKVY